MVTCALVGIASAALAELADGGADRRAAGVARVPLGNVALSGTLGARHEANALFLRDLYDAPHPWRTPPHGTRDPRPGSVWMVAPFKLRGTATNLKAWDGEYAGKWADAAALTVANTGDRDLRTKLDALVAALRAAQSPDGYLGIDAPDARFGAWDLWNQWYALTALLSHGTLLDSAESLDAAARLGDYIARNYAPLGRRSITAGAWQSQPAVLDQLVRLYHVNQDARMLDIGAHIAARFAPLGRMRAEGKLAVEYADPRWRTHAYVANASLGGMALYCKATEKDEDLNWIASVWSDIAASHQIHTGSVGQSETYRFPDRYTLDEKMQETCATVEWLLLTERLYEATGNVKYAHQIEHTVYNALLGAQSTDGMRWMYHTPLNSDLGKAWFSGPTFCCYFSGPRAIARMPQYVFHTEPDAVRVDLYESCNATITLDGTPVSLTMDSAYLSDGSITLTLDTSDEVAFALKLRLPPWATRASLTVNEVEAEGPLLPGAYAVVERTWRTGDVIRLAIEPTVFYVRRPAMTSIPGVALQRGPEVLALDQRDNPGLALDVVAFPVKPRATPAGTSTDGRRLYRCAVEVEGRTREALFTPFAVCGDGTAYRAILPQEAAPGMPQF